MENRRTEGFRLDVFFEKYWLPDCLDVCNFRFGSHDALNGVVEVQGCLVGCPRRYGDRYG